MDTKQDRIHSSGLKKQTDNPFLNMYEIDAIQRDGTHFPYYFATRREEGDTMFETQELKADGVVIYPISQEHPDCIVLLRQFRYPVNSYVYEVPAGLVDAGEDPLEAATRELWEETGLEFHPVTEYDTMWKRPFIQAQGMSDECNITVFGYASGQVSLQANEGTEDIEVVLADRVEVRRILREEHVSIRAAYLLMLFLQAEATDPFAFLR